MDENPYTPPSANLDKPGTNLTGRPKAVWVYSVFATLWAVLVFIGILTTCSAFTSGAIGPPGLLLHLSWRLLMLAALLLSIKQSHQGKKSGRWSGLIAIGIVIATTISFPLLRAINIANTSPDPSSSYVMGTIVGTLLALVLMTAPAIYWFYAFGFSAKAKAYFRIPDK